MAFRATSAITLAAALALSVAGCGGSGAGSLAGTGRPPATDPAPEPPHPATDRARAAVSMLADIALKAMCEPPRSSWGLTSLCLF